VSAAIATAVPAQGIGADAELGQHLGGGGRVRQGVQEVVDRVRGP
jgi:hypothetical protein